MTSEEKLLVMGYEWGPFPQRHPVFPFENAVRDGNLVYVSGQISVTRDNTLIMGTVGGELSVQQGIEAAELCAFNCLRAAGAVIGSLDDIERIIKMAVRVNNAPGFVDMALVANGASTFLHRVFDDPIGRHARSATGAALPLGAAVEITDMLIRVR